MSACLLSVRARLACSYCMRSQPMVWHPPTGSRMQQVLSSLDVLVNGHGLSRHTANSTAPPSAKVSEVQSGGHVDLCQVQFQEEIVSFNDHRFRTVFDGHQEFCVPSAGLCIFLVQSCVFRVLSCVLSLL